MMRGYTTVEQSKKLAEILPLKSADMCHNINKMSNKQMPPIMTPYSKFEEFYEMKTPDFLIPCWSLSALLQLFPHDDTHGVELNNYCGANDRVWFVRGNYGFTFIRIKDELIDACVEMILKLHEENLI